MPRRPILAAAVITALAGGCGTEPAAPPMPSPTAAQSPSLQQTPAEQQTPTAQQTPTEPETKPSPRGRTSAGWEITVYYTAVEKYHDGVATAVTGCRVLDCSNGGDDLGSYPADFVDAVRDEGTGLTASGRYLNWSYDVGFWLDSVARASDGGTLEPFVSAAADSDVLGAGTGFGIVGCGRLEDGSTPPAAVCARLRAAKWRISDEFTPGLGGSRHIDAYIGPETGPGFTDSDWYLTLVGATLTLI